MKHRPAASAPNEATANVSNSTASESPVSDPAEKKWQVDSASGVPAPVIRANMISLRRSTKGRLKVAFFEQG